MQKVVNTKILKNNTFHQFRHSTTFGVAFHHPSGLTENHVRESDLLKQWKWTHFLEGCSPDLVSGSDLLKHWRWTHKLDGCSPNLVSGSDLLNQTNTGDGLTYWMGVHPISSVDLICSITGDGLTSWMGVHPISSVDLICSITL